MSDTVIEDKDARTVPSELWDRIRADPVRAPEHLALAAAEYHGPAARAFREEHRGTKSDKLARKAKRKHARIARLGGAVTGVGGFMTVVPDLAAAAWIQSRVVYFVAASYDWDPLDPMRPAEQLALQGLYENPAEAREALDGVGMTIAEAMVHSRLSKTDEEALVSRLARMVGRKAAVRMAGRMIPGFAIAFNAIGNERETRELADRAISLYRR